MIHEDVLYHINTSAEAWEVSLKLFDRNSENSGCLLYQKSQYQASDHTLRSL